MMVATRLSSLKSSHEMPQKWADIIRPVGKAAAFSLIEVLASLFILTLSAVGITTAWRLADYQELLTRADRRAERILRQYYELQTFAPADSRPFPVNGISSPSTQDAITGYLYYPRLIRRSDRVRGFGKMIPFSVAMTTGTVPGTISWF